MQALKGAAGQLSMEQDQVGCLLKATEKQQYCRSHLSIDPTLVEAGVDIIAVWMDPPTVVYSRLLSAMCSRLPVGPDRPPSSSSSSSAVWCWNSSLDRSPELEVLSSFWMSLLGSAGASRNRLISQNVNYMGLKAVIIDNLTPGRCGSYSGRIKHLRKSSQLETS